ncbi:MAG: cupin domain-containing protein [candidate division WWE3 bacterium]|nr:cupin domain-containing protein [candidate division WWE3 bacterium]
MSGYVTDIEKETLENNNFRRVLYTAKHSQLVVMSLNSGEDIGEEVHEEVDQFFRIEAGAGKTVLEGKEYEIGPRSVVVVPAGTRHNIANTTSDTPLKLYTLYSPPNHRDGTIHATKAEAKADEEYFDGTVSK